MREPPPLGATPRPRVLMVGPLPPPVGGMASVVANLRGALAPTLDVEVLNNVKTTATDRALYQGVIAQLRLLGDLAWRCLSWRPAIVHVHTCSWFNFWRNGADVLIARLLGRRVMLHIHGGQFETFLNGLGPVRAWLARRLLGLAHRVVVLSDGWKRVLDAWADPHRVVVVPNGVPVPAPRPAAPAAAFGIVCLGNYAPAKGQADLLRAAARLSGERPVTVELLGPETEPGYRDRLRALAEELGIGARVDIPGPALGADKATRLARAACFCLPSYDEGLPMSMLEAMALGLPVVVSRVGAVPETVRDGVEGLLFAPGDIDALAAHLQTLADDPQRAAAIGAAGRERVRQEFSLEQSVERLLQVYAELTSSGGEQAAAKRKRDTDTRKAAR
jgi:glycosyltransferase involved in cell wall biosynthesis